MRLRDDLHWCDCSGEAVFLDAAADRYFCLPRSLNDAFLRMARGGGRDKERAVLTPLIERGLLVECDPDGPRLGNPPVQRASCDLFDDGLSRPGAMALFRALACEIAAARQLRTTSFQRILERIRSDKRAHSLEARRTLPAMAAIVAGANAVSLVTRVTDRCLVRALAVREACSRNGIATRLVFGVRMHPFAAHCWVELGECVVVGEFDQVRLYTPILALG
jgi:hypothetical protein